jgi:peptidyl-prolyl cis-trans isomerase B (cyclophilin B)
MVTISNDSRATIRTSMGDLVLEFLSDKAPKTVDNFLLLAQRGFYDGLTFHRIVKDFMVQGGCPKGNGSGGPDHTIGPEFNDTPHVKGVVSMARSGDPHSAGSQFFICHGEARYLDGRFAAFARVVDGVDVLDKIASVPTNQEPRFKENSVPRDAIYINSIQLEGVVFDEPAPAPVTSEPAEGGGRSKGQGENRGEGQRQEGRSGRGRRSRSGGGRSGSREGSEAKNQGQKESQKEGQKEDKGQENSKSRAKKAGGKSAEPGKESEAAPKAGKASGGPKGKAKSASKSSSKSSSDDGGKAATKKVAKPRAAKAATAKAGTAKKTTRKTTKKATSPSKAAKAKNQE